MWSIPNTLIIKPVDRLLTGAANIVWSAKDGIVDTIKDGRLWIIDIIRQGKNKWLTGLGKVTDDVYDGGKWLGKNILKRGESAVDSAWKRWGKQRWAIKERTSKALNQGVDMSKWMLARSSDLAKWSGSKLGNMFQSLPKDTTPGHFGFGIGPTIRNALHDPLAAITRTREEIARGTKYFLKTLFEWWQKKLVPSRVRS